MTVTVKINQGELGKVLTGSDGEVSQFMLRVGIQVATGAKRRCPVDTGRLRSAIGVIQKFTSEGAVTTVTANTNYAVYVHEGTRFMAGRPFLRDALNDINI